MFFSSAWDVVSSFLVFLLGALLAVSLARVFSVARWRAILIYFIHTIFCVCYFVYVNVDGGDAVNYYHHSLDVGRPFSLGTSAVIYLTAVFSLGLHLSFFSVSLVYNILGFVGVLSFYGALREVVQERSITVRRAAFFVMLLPSLNFWSSAIGKDSIAFLSVGLLIWACVHIRQRYWLILLATFLMLLVRPHMAGFIVLSFCFMFVFKANIAMHYRIFVGLVSGCAAIFVVPLAMDYAGLQDGSGIAELSDYIEKRETYNQSGGGAVDISSMSPIGKMFTYMFRPLPHEVSGWFQLLAALENIGLLLFFVIGVFAFFKRVKIRFPDSGLFLIAYTSISWIMLSFTTANLGISSRQKWMVLPVLIYLIFVFIGRLKKQSRQLVPD